MLHLPKQVLSKVGSLHSSHRRERYPVAHIPDGPDTGNIALTEIVHLDTAFVIQLDPNLHKAAETQRALTLAATGESAGSDSLCTGQCAYRCEWECECGCEHGLL